MHREPANPPPETIAFHRPSGSHRVGRIKCLCVWDVKCKLLVARPVELNGVISGTRQETEFDTYKSATTVCIGGKDAKRNEVVMMTQNV